MTWKYVTPIGDFYYTLDPRFVNMIFADVNRVQVDYGRWGYTRGGGTVWHGGLDVDTMPGTDWTVYSTVAGRVKWARMVAKGAAGWGGTWQWGWFVWIVANDGTQHIFAHMAANSLKVVEGQRVSAGQALGTMGMTGNASGDAQAEHVHYEVRSAAGISIDPTPWCGMLNKQGQTTNPKNQKEATDKMYCFDVTVGGKLELFTTADVSKVARDAKGQPRKLPAGKSILLKEVTLANMQPGFSNTGVYIELEGTHERLYAASGLGGCEIVQNDTKATLDRFYPDGGASGVPKSDYDAVVKDRDAQKAAKEVALQKVAKGLAEAQQTVKALEG